MTQQVINTGSISNDGKGDSLRAGAEKINANFTELYNLPAYELPTASVSELGGIKVGDRLSITAGVLSATDQSYTLPTAGVGLNGTLGGVKVDGSSITVSNGIISAPHSTPYTLPAATPNSLGGIKIDNSSIVINNGVISVANVTVTAVESRNYFLDLYNHTVGGEGYGQGHFLQIQGQELTNSFAFGAVAQLVKFTGSVGISDAKHIVLAPDDANGWTMDLGGQTMNQTGFIPPGNTYISNSYINYMYVGNQIAFPDLTIQKTAYQKTTVPAHNYGQAGDVHGMVAYDSTYFYYCTADFVDTSTIIWKRTAWGSTTW